ncbi:myeloid leukemia factor 1 isoform X2 [Cyprinodon tularosa]|uniref:myeloid leukemia factor 1 isoform X2 n=1 Tax=Cyprinodon tularosa TaxID=77115 RepID=UPI0018E2750D|nr:myeloid leukemia factor 1 isoform X2 [Cyprinodon tularosa]
MFNSLLKDFDDDPFFTSDPFSAHRDHMRQMMRSFSEPFGASSMPSITDGRNRRRNVAESPSSSLSLRNQHREISQSLLPFGSIESTDMMQNPFSMFGSVMNSVRNRMEEVNRNFENLSADSNTHSFRSSSIMTYSKVGNEPPKVFQATSQTRCAPGGIKETRQALKDSESGLEKMKIGHHIKDKGHVVEKKCNKKTGEREFNQDFQNMDESEAQSFDEEWQQAVSKFQSSAPMSNLVQLHAAHHAALPAPEQHNAALPAPEQHHRDKRKSMLEGKDSNKPNQ